MFPKIVELKQDRSLISTDFDGYKLSLDPVPVLRQEFPDKPMQAKPSEEQYSFLHVELFGMHNHLVQDPWDRFSSYFITENKDIFKSFYDENDRKPSPLQKVCQLKNDRVMRPGDYNVTFLFVSEMYAVLCDGIKEIFLFDTGNRNESSDWKLVHKATVHDDFRGFVVRDSQIETVEGQQIINVALQHVHKDTKVQGYVTQIFVGNFNQDFESKWDFKTTNTLTKRGSVHYCAFQPKFQALVLSSATKIAIDNTQKTFNEKDQLKSNYNWQQTEEDITVTVCKRQTSSVNDYKVITTENNIEIKHYEDIILAGALFSSIDRELTTWNLEDDGLKVVLFKKSPGRWSYFIENGPAEALSGSEINSGNEGQPISNLEDHIEECDIPANNLEEFTIERIKLDDGNVSHKIFLGGSPPLFCSRLKAGFPPAIITRQDVDASVWLPYLDPSNPDEWYLKHEGNLDAFGYVQASKQQKKFMDCAPDLSYSVICESQRHVFIYKASHGSASGLRNRKGPSISLGKQQLVVLEDSKEVLGLVTANHFITLLTEKSLFYLKLNQS